MRKLIAMLMALLMICGAALADNADELTALEFEHFTLAIRKDAVGTGADTIENNVPFLVVYQDYDPSKQFCSNMNAVWNENVLDLDGFTPEMMATETLKYTLDLYQQSGVKAENARVLNAEFDELNEKRAVSFVTCADLDYSGMGLDLQITLYTLQAVVPLEGIGTYTFTISTNDLENCDELFDIVDSVRWKD